MGAANASEGACCGFGLIPMAARAPVCMIGRMTIRITFLSLAALFAALPLSAQAHDVVDPDVVDPAVVDADVAVPAASQSCDTGDCAEASSTADETKRHRLFPLGGDAAIARGYRIPEPWGLGALIVWNKNRFDTRDLAVAVSKGGDPPADAALLPLPSVTTSRLGGDTRMIGLKGDLWLFPGVNLFASLGEVRGTNRIDVDVDLDAIVPFPFCRPAKPCGSVEIPVETKVKNTTVTLGTILVYGNENWFVLGSVAKTVSISSKKRSDVESTNLALRGGPRFELGKDRYLAPYIGANYFDLETRVQGVVASGPLFEDGDGIHLRYDVEMSARTPFALVAGFNVEFNRHLTLQAEVQAGAESTRIIASTGVRF